MGTPNDQRPSIAWLVGFVAMGILCTWEFNAKPGGWIEFSITAYVLIFMFGSATWHLVAVLKADRAKQLAERARLKAFNDANQARRSIEDSDDTPAQ